MNLMDKQDKKNISDSNSDEPKDMLGFEAALVGNGKNVLIYQPSPHPLEEILVKQNCKVSSTPFQEKSLGDASESFDVIVLGDLLQRVKSPKLLLEKLRSYLNTDGYLVCSITNIAHAYNRIKLLNGEFGYTRDGLINEDFLRFFTLQTVLDLLNDFNYSMTKLYRETQDLDLIHNKDLKYFTIPDELIESIKTDPESLVSKYVFSVIPTSNNNSGTYDYLKEFPRSMATERLKEFFRYYQGDIAETYDRIIDEKNNVINELEKKLDEKNSQIDQLKRKLNDTENK